MIFESGPETRIRFRKGDLEKLGIKTEGSVLSGKMGVADALDRQRRALANPLESRDMERLRKRLSEDQQREDQQR